MKKLIFLLLFPVAAFAQLELPFPVKLVNPSPVDFFYYESDGTPYDDTSEVLSQVLSAVRYQGQTFNVDGVEYWFKDGTTDGDLEVKLVAGGFVSQALTDDVVIDGDDGTYGVQFGNAFEDKELSFFGVNAGGIGLFASDGTAGGYLENNNVGFEIGWSNGTQTQRIYGYQDYLIIEGPSSGQLTMTRYDDGNRALELAIDTVLIQGLAGTGTRMVVANAQGYLSTQAIPSGGGSGFETQTLTNDVSISGDVDTYGVSFESMKSFLVTSDLHSFSVGSSGLSLYSNADIEIEANPSSGGHVDIDGAYIDIGGNNYELNLYGIDTGIDGNTISISADTRLTVNTGGELIFTGVPEDVQDSILYINPHNGVVSMGPAPTGGGGGITNDAANNELVKSDGTNVTGTQIYSTVDGSLILGNDASPVTTRHLTAFGAENFVVSGFNVSVVGGSINEDDGGSVFITSGVGDVNDGDIVINVNDGNLIFEDIPTAIGTGQLYIDGSNHVSVSAAEMLSSASASTTGGTITLDMDSRKQRIFIGSASFSSAKTIALSNTTNAVVFNFHFEVTNVAAVLTCPNTFLMADENWDGGDDEWTPPATGKYEMAGVWDGTNWKAKVVGPYN